MTWPISWGEINDHLKNHPGGGATHWDDLEGKPFGEKVTVNTLIEEQSITCTSCMSNGYPYWEINPATFELVAGQEYRVVWDGVEYTCLAEVSKYDEGVGLGNLAKIDAGFTNQVDNGLPFGVYHQTDGSWNRILVMAGSPTYSDTVTATISVRSTETAITTIDPKFLPTSGGTPFNILYFYVVGNFDEGVKSVTCKLNGVECTVADAYAAIEQRRDGKAFLDICYQYYDEGSTSDNPESDRTWLVIDSYGNNSFSLVRELTHATIAVISDTSVFFYLDWEETGFEEGGE